MIRVKEYKCDKWADKWKVICFVTNWNILLRNSDKSLIIKRPYSHFFKEIL